MNREDSGNHNPSYLIITIIVFASMLLALLLNNFLGLLQNNAKAKEPAQNIFTIEALTIDGAKILFAPVAISLPELSGAPQQEIIIEPVEELHAGKFQIRNIQTLGNRDLVVFQPHAYPDTAPARIKITDKTSGQSWDLYPTYVSFRWLTSVKNPVYQKFLRNPQSSPVSFRTKKNSPVQISSIGLSCPHEEYCHSLFMYYLVFKLHIEVVDIAEAEISRQK